MRTEYDLEMLREIGFCNGIEIIPATFPKGNWSTPWVLSIFFPMISFVDESHVTIPQVEACITVITQEKRS